MATWRDNTLAKTLATLAGTTRLRVITDPTGTPISEQSSLDSLRAWMTRERLTANRTYYVRTDGSNSNDGLADTAGGAFLTVTKALQVAFYEIDAANFIVTVQVRAGTYTEIISLGNASSNNRVNLTGDATTPSNCVLASGGSATCIFVSAFLKLTISGFETQTTGTHLYAFNAGTIIYQNHKFGGGTCTQHVLSQGNQATVLCFGPTEIASSAARHMSLIDGGNIACTGRTLTLTGTPAFSVAFASIEKASRLMISGCTFVNTATGVRYSIVSNSVIYTNGAATTYLPGGTAGTTATGGEYV